MSNELTGATDYLACRELDGSYFRVNRNGAWMNICFSDLTADERDRACEGRSTAWLKSLAYYLADKIYAIGEDLDITGEE